MMREFGSLKMYTTNFQYKLQYAMTTKVSLAMLRQGPTVIAFLPKNKFSDFSTWYTTNKYFNHNGGNTRTDNNLQLLLLGGFFFEKNKKSFTYNAYFINHLQFEKKLDTISSICATDCFLFENQFIKVFEQLIFQKFLLMNNLINYQYYSFCTTLMQKKNL